MEVGKKRKPVRQEIIQTWSVLIMTSFYGSLPYVLTSRIFEAVMFARGIIK